MITQFDYNASNRTFVIRHSVANNDQSSVIADHLGFFLVKMDADFLKWPNDYCVNVYLDKIFPLFTSLILCSQNQFNL